MLEEEKMFMFSNEVQDPGAEEDKTVGRGIPEDMPGAPEAGSDHQAKNSRRTQEPRGSF